MIDDILEEIKTASKIMRSGGIILYPTDTIWGIGCDATNEKAVEKIYKIKKRDNNKSMLLLIDNAIKLQTYIEDVPPIAWDLVELSTSPLTIIYDGAKNISPNLISQDGSIGIRVTNERFSKELCRYFGKPIVSTSANISGNISPTIFADIEQEIKEKVDYIVNFNQLNKEKSQSSKIIKIKNDNSISIIRE